MRWLPLAATLLPALAVLPCTSLHAQTPRVTVVAGENMYGDVARQIAGDHASVGSILASPEEDPHLFEASPTVARRLAGAAIVVENGANYDPWMKKLLAASAAPARRTIVIADLVGAKSGVNPHLWYDPATMPAFAHVLADALAAVDPAHQAAYAAGLRRFLGSLAPLNARIAALRARYAGTPVTATEPVFGAMAAALGLAMRNHRFQVAVMNGTEPAAGDVAAFETDLRDHRVALLIYNSQASNAAAERLLGIARKSAIPVLGVTETEPAGTPYQQWVLGSLDALDAALSPNAPGHPN